MEAVLLAAAATTVEVVEVAVGDWLMNDEDDSCGVDVDVTGDVVDVDEATLDVVEEVDLVVDTAVFELSVVLRCRRLVDELSELDWSDEVDLGAFAEREDEVVVCLSEAEVVVASVAVDCPSMNEVAETEPDVLDFEAFAPILEDMK